VLKSNPDALAALANMASLLVRSGWRLLKTITIPARQAIPRMNTKAEKRR